MEGKRVLILGIANQKSIAWAIAQELQRAGAELAITYLNESIERRVRPLAEELGCQHVFPCDVQSDEELDRLFSEIESVWGGIDGIVHSVAYADRDDLNGRFCHTSRNGFQLALDVSAYSLIALAGRAEPLMRDRESSILTLSYLGSQRVVRNYNIMGVAKAALEASVRYLAADLGPSGIRVNAISAGPIKTLAASGIPQFKELLSLFTERSPLGRLVTTEDVAKVAKFYMSPDSGAVTGEISYADCGYNIMGV